MIACAAIVFSIVYIIAFSIILFRPIKPETIRKWREKEY